MPVERLPADAAALRARVPAGASVAAAVSEILAAVRTGGDAAPTEIEGRFGGRFRRVGTGELRAALDGLDPDVRAALGLARENVSAVARASQAGERNVDLPHCNHV
ncbi:MAG: histidinol dehydrogenase, partial [Solirubrobacteraceae bacterium]